MKHVSVTGQARRHRPGYAPFCVFVCALLPLLSPARSVAQTTWVNHTSPVLGPGPGWESAWVNFVSVIYDTSQYVMWYSGADNNNGGNVSVGRATSPDGMHWTKDTLNPVMGHGSTVWDGKAAWIPKVLKIGNAYTMWFTGANSSDVWQIGRATSTDGMLWVQDTTNPVIPVGAPGQWDAALVHTGSVLFDGTKYRMWYTGLSQGYGIGTAGIGLATSSDGIHWVKDTLNNPVLVAGSSGAWDPHGVGECSVVYDSASRLYHMFYDGNELDYFQETSGIGYASSADGIHWTKYAGNPVLPNRLPGSWTAVASAPFVLLMESTFHMWYTGGTGVGYATSPRVATGVAEYGDAPRVARFQLQQNYPNPFNPSTTIKFELPNASHVSLTVHDNLGRQVSVLVNERRNAGVHEVKFDGSTLASGVYLCRIQAGDFIQTRKFVLLK
jgi:predicted GH43/DUF377 family glycosyl hydrolase